MPLLIELAEMAKKECRDLGLKILVPTQRCERFAYDNFERLKLDEEWFNLKNTVGKGVVMSFGNTLRRLLEKYIYNWSFFFILIGLVLIFWLLISATLEYQKSRALKINALKNLGSKALLVFETQLADSLKGTKRFFVAVEESHNAATLMFNQGVSDASRKLEGVNRYSSVFREKLDRDIEDNICLVWKQQRLSSFFETTIKIIFQAVEPDTWLSIRRFLKIGSVGVESKISAAGSIITKATAEKMLLDWNVKARQLIETKAKEAAGDVLLGRMFGRAFVAFHLDDSGSKRKWKYERDSATVIEERAISQCLEMLSTMAAIRLDDTKDNILEELSALKPTTRALEWGEVPPERTLITPVQCMTWLGMLEEHLKPFVDLAIKAQEAVRKERTHSNRMMSMVKPGKWFKELAPEIGAKTASIVAAGGGATVNIVGAGTAHATFVMGSGATAGALVAAPLIGGVVAAAGVGIIGKGVYEMVKSIKWGTAGSDCLRRIEIIAELAKEWKKERDRKLATVQLVAGLPDEYLQFGCSNVSL